MLEEIKKSKIEDIPASHKHEHEDYEYYRRKFVNFGDANNTVVSVYEIPTGKSAYPYHFHYKNEEAFYILSGEGILKTPDGEKNVAAGDLVFFPAGPKGAHKLTNSSETDKLVYIDFDSVHDLDICQYPDSDKIAIWGMDINKVYSRPDDVDYYTGE